MQIVRYHIGPVGQLYCPVYWSLRGVNSYVQWLPLPLRVFVWAWAVSSSHSARVQSLVSTRILFLSFSVGSASNMSILSRNSE